MNILIADDSARIRKILEESAKAEGYRTFCVSDGDEALSCFNSEKIDVILLDVMMPGKDGYEVCRQIRRISNVVIIMITAKGEDFERIMGLDTGADDYIVKPFSPKEVMARIRAVMRRIEHTDGQGAGIKGLRIGELNICPEDDFVTVSGQRIGLTKKEIEILWTLAENPGRIYTRDELLDTLWGYDYYGDSRTVDSHIKRLRAKLDAAAHPSWKIQTVWGRGYKMEVTGDEKQTDA